MGLAQSTEVTVAGTGRSATGHQVFRVGSQCLFPGPIQASGSGQVLKGTKPLLESTEITVRSQRCECLTR